MYIVAAFRHGIARLHAQRDETTARLVRADELFVIRATRRESALSLEVPNEEGDPVKCGTRSFQVVVLMDGVAPEPLGILGGNEQAIGRACVSREGEHRLPIVARRELSEHLDAITNPQGRDGRTLAQTLTIRGHERELVDTDTDLAPAGLPHTRVKASIFQLLGGERTISHGLPTSNVDAGGTPHALPPTRRRMLMPFVNVKLVEGVFSTEEKHELAKALTEVMVKFEGSEAFREVVWVLIEELHPDGWHIGGRPFEGPKSLMTTLGKSKAIVETINGNPTTRAEFARLAPIKR